MVGKLLQQLGEKWHLANVFVPITMEVQKMMLQWMQYPK
jgi:hypothetical protein